MRPPPRDPCVGRHAAGVLLALAVVLCFQLAGAAPAGAHAVLVGTSPPPSAVLDTAPDEITVTFNEPVRIESLRVVDETGAVVSGEAGSVGNTIRVALPDPRRGWHAASWRVVSADGHPISGAWTFRIGEGAAAPPSELAEQAEAAVRSSPAARWAWLGTQGTSSLATVVAVGSLFLTVIGIGQHRSGRVLAVSAGSVSLVASLWAAAANGPFSVPGPWVDAVFTGPASGPYLLRAALAGVATTVVAVRGLGDRTASTVAWLSLTAGLIAPATLTGHANADAAVTTIAVGAHLLVGACWLGAIPALALAVTDGRQRGWEVARRFSAAAARLLAATVVLGLGAGWLLTGGIEQTAPTWGRLLIVKLLFVAIAVAAGAWNRRAALSQGNGTTSAPDGMRLPLAVEAAALVAIVVCSVALTHNGPPSAAAATGPQVVDLQVTDEVRAQLVVDPARVGTNWVHLYTLDTAGLPIDVEDVDVAVRPTELDLEPIPLDLIDVGAGHSTGIVEDFGVAGQWEVTVDVRIDRFTEADATATITISP
jgi:copper transport protein